MASVALALVFVTTQPWPAVGQLPAAEGNRSDFRDWQPTQGEVNSRERALGTAVPAAQQRATDRMLDQLDRQLMKRDTQLGVMPAAPHIQAPPP